MRTAASACVSCALGCALITSCTASAEDVRPPEDALFFPSGLAVSNRANALFVANSNSELRYDSGSITVIDLKVVTDRIAAWHQVPPVSEPCIGDTDHRETLICDEKDFIRVGAGVRIGNFATDIALQDFTNTSIPDAPVKLRVIVPTRGDPSVAWADFDGDKLVCSTEQGFAQCDDKHRLASLFNDPNMLPIRDEPFGVFATTQPADLIDPSHSQRGFAIVTHLTSAAITLIDAPEDGNVQISDVATGLFAPDPQTGLLGATGVTGRASGEDNLVYVGSRSDFRIQTFTVGRPENRTPPYLLPSNFFFLDGVGANAGGSVDTRGLQFSSGGDRLYVVNRRPPSLQVYDTTLGPSGVPRNTLTGASDICRQASSVAVLNFGTAQEPDERAYVTCFQDGVVYVVDPSGQSQVEDIITVGRGPYGIATSKDKNLLFVSNVLEDTIAVIDVDPASATRNRVVLRIGIPRVP